MRGLLIDYGGVLTTSVVESFGAFCTDEGIELDLFRRVVLDAARAPDSPFVRVEIGAIDQETFDRELAALLSAACGRALEPGGLKQRMFARAVRDEEMVAAVRAARRAGVRTALVSNSWGGDDYPRAEFANLFDAVVISGEVGMRKPQPEIYRLAASKVGLRESTCVFVDDFRVNVDGAEAIGMTGLLHRGSAETIARLEDLLRVSLR